MFGSAPSSPAIAPPPAPPPPPNLADATKATNPYSFKGSGQESTILTGLGVSDTSKNAAAKVLLGS